MAAESNLVTEPADRVLKITRVFDAPRELLWKAWTDPAEMVKWHGPRGFTSKIEYADFRPGGKYRIYMRGPENDDHWMQGTHREIAPMDRLVMTGGWTDAKGDPLSSETILTVMFEDAGKDKTRLTLHQAVFESVTARDGHNSGWNSTLDRLAEYLAAA
jgi:uncharacterized protein YndB with AHSA1/START domain